MDSKHLVGRDSKREESQIEALATLPPELEEEVGKLDKVFWVSKEKLKEISERFGEELAEGLEENGKNIPMNITWVLGFPTGRENGSFLTLDLGGTNLRVCWITLKDSKRGDLDVKQHQYKLPSELKTGEAEALWNYIAESLEKFITDFDLKGTKDDPLPLGFTFSYPATQDYIDHGILQTWTKGFDIKGVEGEDAAQQLRDAMAKKNLPIRLVALINDTTGAMIASAYHDPSTIIGAIFGTGCNAAYMEDCGSIPKVPKTAGITRDTPMAINCEYGAFDNAHRVLPLTKYDTAIDAESPRPGEQAFEKMSAGLYLGEIFRQVLVDVHSRNLIFKDQNVFKLQQPYILDTGFLSAIEDDESEKLSKTGDAFKETLNIAPTEPELEFIRRLAELIAVRGARLCVCGVAAICRKKAITSGHVAADGSVANKHPKFKKRWAGAMAEILEWPEDREEDPIVLTSAEDGSGVGAAVIVAMTLERAKRGEMAGIKEQG